MNPFRTFLVILFLSLTLQPVFAQQTTGFDPERLARIDQVFEAYVDEGRLPGAVILVARKGEIAYLKAFGQADRENNIPMTESSVFRIASQTKAITSTGIMILQEEGKLLITDPVGKYIPEFAETRVAMAQDDGTFEVVPADRPITIRDLLTHTAGIGYGGGPAAAEWEEAGIQGWYFADREEPVLETVRKMGALPFDAQPGERFVYGYNTDILGALIEVVSGQPLNVFLRERILDPLGMNDTHFYLPENKRDRFTVVYSVTENGLERAPEPGGMVGQGMYTDGPRTSFSGGAGYLSTATDYWKFLQMMLNGGEYNGNRILSRKTVELMTTDHLGDITFPWTPGMGFGLGFEVVKDVGDRGVPGSVGEYGWGGAYHSDYWVDPQEELIVVYFTQVIPASGLDDHGKLRVLVYQALK